MTTVTPALIDGADVTTGESSDVTSPYDGRTVGSVPVCGPEEIDRAVAVALDRHRAGAPPAHERAAVLDRVAAALAERLDEFARSISDESAKPITTARVEASRALDTIRFSAAVARTFTGEMVPMDASAVGTERSARLRMMPRRRLSRRLKKATASPATAMPMVLALTAKPIAAGLAR